MEIEKINARNRKLPASFLVRVLKKVFSSQVYIAVIGLKM